MGAGGDLNVLIERRKHPHQPRDRVAAVMASQNLRQVGLLDAEQLGRGDLRELARLDEAGELDHQRRLEPMLLGVGEPQIGKDVAAADLVCRLLLEKKKKTSHPALDEHTVK